MKNIRDVRREVRAQLADKQDSLPRYAMKLGNQTGDLFADASHKFVYARVSDESLAIPVFCSRLAPVMNLDVWVGYDFPEPTLLQVLSTRTDSPGGPNAGVLGGFAPASRYEWLGLDPVHVYLRAFLPLGIYCTSPASLSVTLYHGIIYNGTEYLEVPSQTINLTSYVPSTANKAALVLISINSVGTVVVTDGADVTVDVPDDLSALMPAGDRFFNAPSIPAGTVFVCALVRMYNTQTEILEGVNNRDIIDLRFPGVGSIGMGLGDMLKSVYDINANGVVDDSEDTQALQGNAIDPSLNPTNGQTIIWNSTTNQFEAGIGRGDDLRYFIDGALAAVTDVAALLSAQAATIDKVYLYGLTLGSSGNTIVDIHLNGTTIFTNQDNRPSLAFDSSTHRAISGVPDVIDLAIGDVLTIDIDGVAVGSRGLAVVIAMKVGAGVGGGSTPTIFPTRATLWHHEALVTVGTSLSDPVHDVNQDYITCNLQYDGVAAGGNDGDTFTQGVVLDAGTYTLYILGAGDLNNGKAQWYMDDVAIGSLQDWYTSGPSYNIIMTVSSIVIANPGRHVLKCVINGKNASSIGYYLPLTKYWLTQASDVMEVE